MKFIVKFLYGILLTLLLAPAFSSAVRAQPPPTCHVPPVVTRGVLVAAPAASRCRLAVKETSGRILPLLDHPALAPLAVGTAVELTGAVVDWQGQPAYKLDSVRVADASARKKYPWRGRCVHCGCHMQLDSAAEAEEVCKECDCKKKGAECLK